jgi:MFS transporter, DHA3 family, macrolide efflux protein
MVLRLLRNRNFFFLWLAQIAATLGNELYNIGVMVAIYELTGSALQATGVLLARTLPSFLFSPLAGPVVDRYDRRLVLAGMNLLRGGLVAFVLLTSAGEVTSIWPVYTIVFGIALADVFYKPAQMALIPSLVARGDLVRANSLMMSTNLAAFALAYGAGGWLLIQFGGFTLILIDLSCFLIGAVAALQIGGRMVLTSDAERAAPAPLHRMFADGLRYLRRHDLARALVTMEALEHWPHGIWTASIMLVFVEQALNTTTDAWGYQLAVFWGSNVVGALLAMLLANQLAQRPGRMIIVNAFINSALTLAYALSPNLTVALLICAFYGVPGAFRDVAQDTLLQSSVEQRMLGRVYATRQMLLSICLMVAALFFAWLADQAPVRWVYLIGGALYLGTALYALAQPALRNARLAHMQPTPEVVAAP